MWYASDKNSVSNDYSFSRYVFLKRKAKILSSHLLVGSTEFHFYRSFGDISHIAMLLNYSLGLEDVLTFNQNKDVFKLTNRTLNLKK